MIAESLPGSLSVVLVAAASLLAGCSSPGLAESWIDPSVQSLSGYDKVFVAYLGTDAAVQRVAEDAMAEHIHAAAVVRCYSLFPDTRELDAEKVKSKLREQGFDAAVVMRAAGVEQRVSESPGSYPRPTVPSGPIGA